jgi:hypothetical protein
VATLKVNYPTAKLGAQGAWNRVHSDMLACRGQYVAAALAPLDSTIDQRRRLISRLSALAALVSARDSS